MASQNPNLLQPLYTNPSGFLSPGQPPGTPAFSPVKPGMTPLTSASGMSPYSQDSAIRPPQGFATPHSAAKPLQNGPSSHMGHATNGGSQVNGYGIAASSPWPLQRTPNVQSMGHRGQPPMAMGQNRGPSPYGYGNNVPSPLVGSGVGSRNVPPVTLGLTQPPSNVNEGASPQITPGTSQPTSARSSRNPSPISSQRYDYMEGQFSNRPSPSNSSANIPNTSTNQNPLLHPPNSGNTPFHSPLIPGLQPPTPGMPYSANSVGASPQPGPIVAQPQVTPQASGPMRQRYPQQVGYNQTQGQTPSPMPSQRPSGMYPPRPPQQSYASSPYQPPSPYQGGLPEGPVGGATGYDPNLHAKMAGMSVHQPFSKLWGNDSINLLQDRHILPPVPLEAPKPVLSPERPNCSPDVFRCTLTKIPDSSSLLQKSRLPFGILLHPFRDVPQLSVIQCNTIVRCRSCRTYINPFITFADQRRWKCNLCFRLNDLPEEFLYDPNTRSYGDPSRRPEIKNATIEYVAPSDYMVRPPQPAVYLFLLDVSHAATETGYLETFCKVMQDSLGELPGDSRTKIGFITFDGSIHFYNLGEGMNQPHMLVISDIEDVFLPSPDNLLVNIQESRSLIIDLLNDLPKRFATNGDVNSCLGSALQVAYKLMSPIGGRITVVQTSLPNLGPGALKNREDPNQRAAKDITNLGPAHDFYKKLALDCSGQQLAVDLFVLCSQYVDIATLSCVAKFSSGCVHYYPGYHHQVAPLEVSRFGADLKRYLTRKIGFEAVMRIRCTRGLSLHTFHGNFFVRSTDLLSLPNVNPDAGYGIQIAIEEGLTDYNSVCFQAAVLYTSCNGERRIRVHTLCLPVVSVLQDLLNGADQEAIIGLVSKMAVDRSLTSLSDARDALINVCVDVLGVYRMLSGGQSAGALMSPYSTRLLPLFVLALLKNVAFRVGVSTKLDERVFAMERMKTLPLSYLMKFIYPTMYPVHALDEKNAIHQDDDAVVPQPVILQLSSEKLDRQGAYLLDTLDHLLLFVCRSVGDHFCATVLGVTSFGAIPEDMTFLPSLPTPESERMCSFVTWLQAQRPFHSPLKIIREDSKDRHLFLQYMLDDRTESLYSYYEFLQHISQQISK